MADQEQKPEIVKLYNDTDINDFEAKVGGKRNLKEVIITDDAGVQFYFLVKRPTRQVIQASAEAMENVSVVVL